MTACKWNGRNEPRVLPGRHGQDCGDETCGGCAPCEQRHCVIDGRTHLTDAHPLTCPSCIGDVRDDLDQIVDMHSRLRGEAIVRGMAGERDGTVLGGDAMVMLAMRYREQTGIGSDGDHSHESDADPVPTLLTLATWEDCWRDHLGHDTADTAEVAEVAGYLALMLTRMAQDADLPFDDFARDIRNARGRLEDVLRDGEREETGAPCPDCGRRMVKHYGKRVIDDRWRCPDRRECKAEYTEWRYRGVVDDRYLRNATALTARDMHRAHDVPEGSVRAWASEKVGKVRKRGKDANGLQLYDVADVLAMKAGRQSRESA